MDSQVTVASHAASCANLDDVPTRLTARENSIMRAVLRGCSNQKIASNSYISVNTVKYHLKNIYRKLEVNSRTEAVWIYAGLDSDAPT